mgnify:CR=1 FL=1
MRGATRIFRPEVYDTVFPPSELEQALRAGLDDEGEQIQPDDFSSIDQFLKGLGDLKSDTIVSDGEWV